MTEAPPAQEIKASNFVSLEPFPEEGPAILTITAYNYIPNYQNVRQDGSCEVINAVEFYLGTNTANGPRFIKTWPCRYSIHEKSTYSKIYKYVTGHLPTAGSSPKDILGGGVQADIENEERVGKKSGKKYTASRAKDLGPVFPKLKGEIVDRKILLPALEKLLAEDGKKATGGTTGGDTDGPPF
jgi:hypothetical protein